MVCGLSAGTVGVVVSSAIAADFTFEVPVRIQAPNTGNPQMDLVRARVECWIFTADGNRLAIGGGWTPTFSGNYNGTVRVEVTAPTDTRGSRASEARSYLCRLHQVNPQTPLSGDRPGFIPWNDNFESEIGRRVIRNEHRVQAPLPGS